MVLAWHRTPGTRTRRARPGRIRPGRIRHGTIRYGTIRYGAAVAVALTLAGSAVAAAEPAASAGTVTTTASCSWVHSHAPVAQRVRQLMAAMTLDDKLTMVDGVGFSTGTAGYVGHIAANPGLCIPGLNLEDGPQGVADSVPGVTQLPAPTALAAAWDPPACR
jgi:beta-glucosidase